MRDRQRDIEKFLTREFFTNALGLAPEKILSRRPPRPDIYVVIRQNGQKTVIEVELTEYQNDIRKHQAGSPGERLNSFWLKVQESLRRRLTKKPIKVEAIVSLKDPSKVKNKDARAIAGELVRLARAYDFSRSNDACLANFQPEFSLLSVYVRKLILKRVEYYSIGWTCTDISAGMVGVSPEIVAKLIRRKENKPYKWARNSRKWLLICASGRSIVAHGGPIPAPGTWQNLDLQAACRSSPFERVFFWDRVRGWHRALK